jgi:elongation factor Tu
MGCYSGLLLALLLGAGGGEAMASEAPARGAKPGARAEAAAGDFRMPITDVFKIVGRGIVTTGKIESGTVVRGDYVCIDPDLGPLPVAGIEQFNKILDKASAGDNVGLLFTTISQQSVKVGTVIRSCDD